ncbi:hypothetical protein BT69DRAFT_1280429 [Atractiella rhizophila]|nr:hypothetical protein BT69DRAFT_1280429 [Atractiella rhizophila]
MSENPSAASRLEEFMIRQMSPETMIYCYRSDIVTATIPPTLLHAVFGTFLDDCENHEVTKEDSDLTIELCSVMSDLYPNEDRRAHAIRRVFRTHGIHLVPSDINRYRTDGDISGAGLRYAIAEFKNEIGKTGAEPYAQGILDYFESTRDHAVRLQHSSLPCMFILLFGPYISFAGAVWNLRPVIQTLSFALPLHHHPTDTNARRTVARHLAAFRKTVNLLDQYYRDVETDTTHLTARQPQLYPYRTTFTPLEGGDPLNFDYISQPHDQKLVFLCNQSERSELCVKFARQYSKEAHLICASLGFAPKLRGFEELPGGWKMVVMDWLSEKEYIGLTMLTTPASTLLDTIERRLGELHQRSYVHGDVRRRTSWCHGTKSKLC